MATQIRTHVQKDSTFKSLNTVTTKYTDLVQTGYKVSQFEDKEFSPSQRLASITYLTNGSEGQLQIQGPKLQLFNGGIPNPHPQYYPTDDKRMFVKVPEDPRDPACLAFFAKLEELDNYMQTDAVKTILFGKLTIANQYAYQPIVRTSEDDSEELDEDGNPVVQTQKTNKPRFMKVKIPINFKSKKIDTKIFTSDADGKRTRVPEEEINTIDDVKKYVRYLSYITPIIVAQKVYQQKTKKDKNDVKKYGVTFKLHQVVCLPYQGGAARDPNKDDFVDDDNTYQLSSVQIVAGEDNTVTVNMNEDDNNDLDNNDFDHNVEDEPVHNTVNEPLPTPVVVQTPPPVVATTKPRGKRAVN